MRLASVRVWNVWMMIMAGVLATGASGCGVDEPSAVAIVVAPSRGLAVVNGDFTSTSVSLLAGDGTLAKDDCIDSGTQASGKLSLTLSGDVTLPSQPQRGGDLWLIDRANAALTIVEPTKCAVRGQVAVGTGFKANPHDVVVVSDTKVYVTRYEKNLKPDNPNATGDDILILDRDTGAITGQIDLGAYAAPVAGASIQARPDRMVIAAGKVFVTLGSQDAKFLAAGEGRVAVVDPVTDLVEATVALEGLKGCSAMHVLAADKTLFVACGGSFADADQAAGSGVAELDLSTSPPKVARVTKAAVLGGQPVNFSWVAAQSATRVFVGTLGTFGDAKNNVPGTKDAAFVLDPAAGTATPLGLEGGAFDLGRAAVTSKLLLVPDAAFGKPLVHVFDVPGSGTPTEKTTFAPNPAQGLQPREIAWY